MSRQISDTRKKLEEYLYNRMGASETVLKEWETDPYPVDGEVVAKFWKMIEDAPGIEIVGDYDCDGICSSYILSAAIKDLHPGKRVLVRMPRRFSEGYGISDTIADEIINDMPSGSLVITVDNGIAAAPILERIRNAGFKVIVTDHHEMRKGKDCRLPDVDMLIDPSVKDIPNPFSGSYWCGAGVTFKLCEPMLSEELAKKMEVFAGLATVADCMELKEGNWGLVRRAIASFRNKTAPESLRMLLKAMNQDPDFCREDHFGFYLGPVFNAPGRLLDKGAIEVLRYLSRPSEEACKRLVDLNNERKAIRDEEFAKIKTYIEENKLADTCPIWVAYPGLHEGIVGILAGKLAEEYKRPAIVLTNTETPGMLKGSARSYGEINIFQYLSGIPEELFAKMGGHKGAAGLSMTEGAFDIAKTYQIPMAKLEETWANSAEVIHIDKWEIPGVNTSLNKFRPFGEGNISPKFEVEVNLGKDCARLIGENKNHLLIQDQYGKYKLTHFNHIPNELSNANRFGMIGTIAGSVFAGVETPSFNADEVFDLEDEKERQEERE